MKIKNFVGKSYVKNVESVSLSETRVGTPSGTCQTVHVIYVLWGVGYVSAT